MGGAILSGGVAELTLQFLFFFAVAAHFCLFIDLSRFQKHPTSKFNNFLASSVSATTPLFLARFFPVLFASYAHMLAIALMFAVCVALTLTIQKILPFV